MSAACGTAASIVAMDQAVRPATAPRAVAPDVARFARFCAVGATNTAVTFATFALLGGVRVGAAPAAAIGFAAGAANGYLLNRSWTFRSRRRGAGTVVRYVAVQALGAACSAAGVALASGDLALRRLVAETLVTPFVTVLTYALSRRVVFGAGTTTA